MLILRVSMSSSIDSGLTCVGTRSRQTSIHDPSPQPVSQARGAGEPVGLHHGPSLRRRRGGGERIKIKTRQRSCHLLHSGSPRLRRRLPRGALTSAPVPSEDAAPASGPRRAAPRGVCARPPARPAGARSLAGLGRCPTGSPRRQPLQDAKMTPPPLGERAAATKWCLSGPTLQWRDGRGRMQAGRRGDGAGPAGGRLRRAGAGELGRALRPAPAHSPSHPLARTRGSCSCCGGWRRLVH